MRVNIWWRRKDGTKDECVKGVAIGDKVGIRILVRVTFGIET